MKRILLLIFLLQGTLLIQADEFIDYEWRTFNYEQDFYDSDYMIHGCSFSDRLVPPLPHNMFCDFFKKPLDTNTANTLYQRLNQLREAYGPLKKGDYVSWYEEDGRAHKSVFETIQKTQSKIHVIFINGIKTTYTGFRDNLLYLLKIAPNINLYGVYNSTKNFEKDIFECHLGLYGIETPPTKHLKDAIQTVFKQLKWGDKLIIVCHSQGAIHTYNALQKLPYEIRGTIKVLAIAPAKFIPIDLIKDSLNVISLDFVPSLQYLYGFTRANSNIKELITKMDAMIVNDDHSFQSLTYKEIIKDNLCR
jgi:pimeloyl-ACP methyl ester carboxylesterase